MIDESRSRARLETFDYLICGFGLLGTLVAVLWIIRSVPTALLFLCGLLSIGVSSISVITLLGSLTGYLPGVARGPLYLYVASNFFPSLVWFFQRFSATQVPTPPGCC